MVLSCLEESERVVNHKKEKKSELIQVEGAKKGQK